MASALTVFDASAQQGRASVAQVATDEVRKRQQAIQTAQKFIQAGSIAQVDRRYGEAMDNFKHAFEMLPDSPNVDATRRMVFQRYQKSTIQFSQQMIDEAKWENAKQALTVAINLGSETGMPPSSLDPGLKRMLMKLNDSEYYETAITPEHLARVEKVKSLLILAQGYYDYGKYDEATRAYNQVLSIDRTNSAARRGMEMVERQRINYFQVARDQTRARAMREIGEEWESPVPTRFGSTAIPIPEGEVALDLRLEVERKLKSIFLPTVNFTALPLTQVLDFLRDASVRLDQSEPDISKRGINFILDPAIDGNAPVTLRMNNAPMNVVLNYATQLTNSSYRVDDYTVKVGPLGSNDSGEMITRMWTVPPSFMSGGGGGAAPVVNDPFAAPAANTGGGIIAVRKNVKEFLTESGITFGDGATASYNKRTNTLLVKNTPDQMDLVESLVRNARNGISKMVEVGIKIIKIREDLAKEKKIDWLLGQSNLGSSPKVFFGGGTSGNDATPAIAGDFPFVNPGTNAPSGVFPVTDGLRGINSSPAVTTDSLLTAANQAGGGESPAVFSVAGIFTDPQFQATLRAFTQRKGIDMLCDTKVSVLPGRLAKLEMIREFPYPTEYEPPQIPTNVGNTNPVPLPGQVVSFPVTPATPAAFDSRALGKILEVEPTVSADNTLVTVNVVAEISDFVGFINYGSPIINGNFLGADGNPVVVTPNQILMPIFDTIRETTTVEIYDGQTVAIGGLIGHTVEDTQDKIPFLGDLPGVGRAFRGSSERHVKTGMIIFLTVNVVDPGGQRINDLEKEENELTAK